MDFQIFTKFSLLYWWSFLSCFLGVGSILRNGMERNDGLNRGTERFLNLKLAGYHCLLVLTQVISSPSSEWLNTDRNNWKIDCGILLVAISNEVVIVGFVGWVMIDVGCSNKETHQCLWYVDFSCFNICGWALNYELLLISSSKKAQTDETIILAVQLNLIEDQTFGYATFFE